MPGDKKYSVTPELLSDFSATIEAKPDLTEVEIFEKFPEFGGDKSFLQAATDYYATSKSGKYKSVDELNVKFPEFDFSEKKKPSLDLGSPEVFNRFSQGVGQSVKAPSPLKSTSSKSSITTPVQVNKPDAATVNYAPIIKGEDSDRTYEKAFKRGQLSGEQADLLNVSEGNNTVDLDRIAHIQGEMQKLKASDSYQKFNNAKSFTETMSALAENPVGIIAELSLESLSALVRHGASRVALATGTGAAMGSVVPGIGTAFGAGAGAVTGTGLASLNLEYSNSIIGSLQEAGVDITSAEDLKKAFSDEKKMSEIRTHALEKGVPVALFDMLSAGVAGRILSQPAKTIGKKLLKGTAEVGIQGALGGAGEVSGEVVSGEPLSWPAIMGEVVGEIGGGAPEIVTGTIVHKTKTGEPLTPQEKTALAIEAKKNPEAIYHHFEVSVGSGEITPEQVVQIKEEVKPFAEAIERIPSDVPEEKVSEIAPMLIEKEALKAELETVDDVFKGAYTEKIAAIDEGINQIVNPKLPENDKSNPDNAEKKAEADENRGKITSDTQKEQEKVSETEVKLPKKETASLIQEATDAANDINEIYREPFLEDVEAGLKQVSEQVNNPASAETARKVFGDKIADIAQKLYPDAMVKTSDITADKKEGENVQPLEEAVVDSGKEADITDDKVSAEVEEITPEKLESEGINVETLPDAEKMFSEGYRAYSWKEQDFQPSEITDIEVLRKIPLDEIAFLKPVKQVPNTQEKNSPAEDTEADGIYNKNPKKPIDEPGYVSKSDKSIHIEPVKEKGEQTDEEKRKEEGLLKPEGQPEEKPAEPFTEPELAQANDEAVEEGFEGITHKINSINKREKTDYKTIQEIPADLVKKAVARQSAKKKVDEIAEKVKKAIAIKGMEDVKKSGFGQDELIDELAKIVKTLIDAGYSVKEAIDEVMNFSKRNDSLNGFNEDAVRDGIQNKFEGKKPEVKEKPSEAPDNISEPPAEKKERKISKRFTSATYPLPESLKYYTPINVEETESWANDFYKKYGYEGAIEFIENPPTDVASGVRVILAAEVSNRLQDEIANETDLVKIAEANDKSFRLFNTVVPESTKAAQYLRLLQDFYKANPYIHVTETQKALDEINRAKKERVAILAKQLNLINKEAAKTVGEKVAKSTNVVDRINRAKSNLEKSNTDLKRVWNALKVSGISPDPYNEAKKVEQFNKALAKVAKDFIIYQSVKFEAFVKHVAAQLGIGENLIDKDHLQGIFDSVKEKEIGKEIKSSLKDLGIKLSELVEAHYSELESTETKLSDKLKSEFGLSDKDADAVSELIKKEFQNITAKEKLKAIKSSGLLQSKWWNTLVDLSNSGALDNKVVLEQLADKIGIKEITPEIRDKMLQLAKAIREVPEGTKEQARRIQDLENYKAKIAHEYGFTQLLVGNFLTNIFGSIGANEINAASNILVTTEYGIEHALESAIQGKFGDVSIVFKAMAKGYANGWKNTKEVFATGRTPYKEIGDLKATNIWELLAMSPKENLTPYESVFRHIVTAALAERKFFSRALVAMDALSGTTNYEVASVIVAMNEADRQGLRGKERQEFILESISRSNNKLADAEAQATKDGLKEGTKEYNERVEDYVKNTRPKWLQEKAKAIGLRLTLTQAPPTNTVTGFLAQQINNAIKKKPLLKFVVPVTNTVANLFIRQYERTPLELINLASSYIRDKNKPIDKKIFEEGFSDPEFKRRLTASVSGTIAGAALFLLAGGFDKKEKCFEIFGAGTGDKEFDNFKRSQGWKPYSIRFKCGGDYWDYSYTPMAMLLGMVGDIRDYSKYDKGQLQTLEDKLAKDLFKKTYEDLSDDQKAEIFTEMTSGKYNYEQIKQGQFNKVVAQILSTPLKLFLNYGFMSGVNDLMSIAQERSSAIGTKLVKFGARTVNSIFEPAWMREIKLAHDPRVYEGLSFYQEVIKNLPFVEFPDKVKIDGFGRDISSYDKSNQSAVVYLLTRRFVTRARGTELDAFLTMNGISVSPPKNTDFMIEKDYRAYITIAGKLSSDKLNEMYKGGDFEDKSPAEISDLIDKTIKPIREFSEVSVRNKNFSEEKYQRFNKQISESVENEAARKEFKEVIQQKVDEKIKPNKEESSLKKGFEDIKNPDVRLNEIGYYLESLPPDQRKAKWTRLITIGTEMGTKDHFVYVTGDGEVKTILLPAVQKSEQ